MSHVEYVQNLVKIYGMYEEVEFCINQQDNFTIFQI
jgi:hypothetical protein